MGDICEQAKQGFEFAARYAELLITLAIGLVGLSITFTKEILRVMPRRASPILFLSWTVLGASVYFGFLHHGGLIGDLLFPPASDTAPASVVPAAPAAAPKAPESKPACVSVTPSPSTTVEGRRQWWTFFVGTALFVVYGVVGHFFHDPRPKASRSPAVSEKRSQKKPGSK
jgi:hypothetical protein